MLNCPASTQPGIAKIISPTSFHVISSLDTLRLREATDAESAAQSANVCSVPRRYIIARLFTFRSTHNSLDDPPSVLRCSLLAGHVFVLGLIKTHYDTAEHVGALLPLWSPCPRTTLSRLTRVWSLIGTSQSFMCTHLSWCLVCTVHQLLWGWKVEHAVLCLQEHVFVTALECVTPT